MLALFAQLRQARETIIDQVAAEIGARLDARPAGPRHQIQDDHLFGPANTAIALAIGHRDYHVAVSVFRRSYELALTYEGNNQCEIHKGAMAFNAGIASLRIADFPAAMHNFELAERETRLTSGSRDWNVYLTPDLFDPNFWDTVEAAAVAFPVTVYEQFWGVRLGKAAGKANWRRVSAESKLLYLMCLARRVHYRQVAHNSGWDGSQGLRLSYWNLVADLARLLETQVYRRAKPVGPKTYKLHDLLTKGFKTTRLGDLSILVDGLHKTHKVKDTPTFNAAFPKLRSAIERQNDPLLDRLAPAAYLMYATRNQVQHHVDHRLVLYRRPEAAEFVTQVLLTLCRLDSWAR